jgi:hypothetical protein
MVIVIDPVIVDVHLNVTPTVMPPSADRDPMPMSTEDLFGAADETLGIS